MWRESQEDMETEAEVYHREPRCAMCRVQASKTRFGRCTRFTYRSKLETARVSVAGTRNCSQPCAVQTVYMVSTAESRRKYESHKAQKQVTYLQMTSTAVLVYSSYYCCVMLLLLLSPWFATRPRTAYCCKLLVQPQARFSFSCGIIRGVVTRQGGGGSNDGITKSRRPKVNFHSVCEDGDRVAPTEGQPSFRSGTEL